MTKLYFEIHLSVVYIRRVIRNSKHGVSFAYCTQDAIHIPTVYLTKPSVSPSVACSCFCQSAAQCVSCGKSRTAIDTAKFPNRGGLYGVTLRISHAIDLGHAGDKRRGTMAMKLDFKKKNISKSGSGK